MSGHPYRFPGSRSTGTPWPTEMETWSVGSYGYPNPFGSTRAQGAWEVFDSFGDGAEYAEVKAHWKAHPTRPIDPHAVESWKASFEECGLLYVLRGDNTIHLTPGGQQLRAAAASGDADEFAWIGMNLLLRYPLRGTGRRSRGEQHEKSDLPLYWFVLAAMVELDGFWQSELNRVLSSTFTRAEAIEAVDKIRRIRAGDEGITMFSDPTAGAAGGVYNAINQVMVKGSLNHMLFTSQRSESPYGDSENFRSLTASFRDIVKLALGIAGEPIGAACAGSASLMERIPAAHGLNDEQAYFDQVGAQVMPLAEARARSQYGFAPAVEYGGESVWLLTEGTHFERTSSDLIQGPAIVLCVLAPEQRVIVSDDLDRTYLVVDKQLNHDQVAVRLRPARPIHDPGYVQKLLEG